MFSGISISLTFILVCEKMFIVHVLEGCLFKHVLWNTYFFTVIDTYI